MSNSYENINSDIDTERNNTYLKKKRINEKEYIPNDNKYHYKFKKYYSKPFKENYYYNIDNPRNNYYNKSNSFYNKFIWNKNYKKYYHNNYNNYERIIKSKNDYNILSLQNINLKEKDEEQSLNSFSSSTNFNSPNKPIFKNGFNQFFHQSLKKDNHDNINNENDFKSMNYIKEEKYEIFDENKIKNEKNEENEEKYEKFDFMYKIEKIFKKISNYEPFNINQIIIYENPLNNFQLYPEDLFTKKFIPDMKKDKLINNDVKECSIESCYLLAKIPNW